MGVTCAVTRAAATIDTPPYTQAFTTTDLGGLTPKAAIFIVTSATTDGTAANDAIFSIGACDDTNEWATCITDDHNVGTTECNNVFETNACIQILDPSDGSIDFGEAQYSSFAANTVTINWVTAPNAAYLVTVVLFAGTDLSVHADTEPLNNLALPESFDITAPGFEPDIVFCAIVKSATAGAIQASGNLGFGFAHNDGVGGVTQRALGNNRLGGQATSADIATMRNDAGIVTMSAGLDWYGSLGSFDANGFTFTINNAPANNQDLNYLALNFGGVVDSWVGTHTTPTSTGNDSETGPGFTPQLVMMLPTKAAEAVNTVYTDSRAGSCGIAVFDADDEYCNTSSSQDNVGTTNTQSLSDDRAIALPDDAGTLDVEGTFVSFDANGWTVNYSNAPATALLFPALAIEAAAEEVHVPRHPSVLYQIPAIY